MVFVESPSAFHIVGMGETYRPVKGLELKINIGWSLSNGMVGACRPHPYLFELRRMRISSYNPVLMNVSSICLPPSTMSDCKPAWWISLTACSTVLLYRCIQCSGTSVNRFLRSRTMGTGLSPAQSLAVSCGRSSMYVCEPTRMAASSVRHLCERRVWAGVLIQ